MKKLNLNININSLDEFYRECDNIEGGDPAEINNIESNDDPSFRGLSTAEIYNSKYSYTKGLDNLKKIEKDINLGGRKHKYKYDDSDGDDMNFDRYIEGLPCLKKRIPTHGIGTGKICLLLTGLILKRI